MVFLSKLGKSLVRNLPEITAFATGQMPAFMYGKRKFRDIPVFCLHAVLPEQFERQLRFLRDNGYAALNAADLEARLNDPGYRNDGKEIVLTFDDGLISLWTVAFPLLQEYGVKVIAFVLPGMADTLPGLCSWQQIRTMHQSGLVDFQSHGMIHPMIAVGSEIIDFVHPGYESDYYGIPQLPFYGDGTTQGDRRIPVPGHPVYRHASRYAGRPRYFDDLRLREECAEFVRRQEPDFFSRKDWRRRLTRVVVEFKARNPLTEKFETPDERDQALRYELGESKRQLELNLAGKPIRHFCNPWYVGSALMARMAFEAGYSALHLGASVGFAQGAGNPGLKLIRRLQGEYLMALPGNGRTGLRGVFREKLQASRRRERILAQGIASKRALVLHVMDKFTVSGSGAHGVLQLVIYLLPRFDPAHYAFKVIGLRKNPPGFDIGPAPGFPIETLNLGKFNPLALLSLLRLIRQERPAVLHLHGYAAWNFGRIAGFLTGTPVVLQEHIAHGSPPIYQSIADRLLSLLPYTAIAVSDTVRSFMRVKRHVRSDKVVVIPNGIPLEEFSSVPASDLEAIRSELRLNRNTRVIGTVGRLDPIKGLDLLLRALPAVLTKVPGLRVVIVGEGPLAGELRRLAGELGIQEQVTFLGHRRDIPRLLSVMDVFVVPSLSEGFCLAAVEAMAAGKVILSSDCEALKNLFRGGESALLFESGNSSHLAEQLLRILSDGSLRAELSQRAVESSRRFNIRDAALAYAEVYDRMQTPG